MSEGVQGSGMGELGDKHRRWAQEDARERLIEGALRLGSGCVVLAAAAGWGLLTTAPAVGVGCGLLAAEVARFLRDRPAPRDIAVHIDQVAQTGWLMQTALSIEAGEAHGSDEMAAAVLRRAERCAEKVSAIAVRPRQAPLPWMVIAAVAVASLALRGIETVGADRPMFAAADGVAAAEAPDALADAEASDDASAGADGAGVAGSSESGARRSGDLGAEGAGGGAAQTGDATAEGAARGSGADAGGSGEEAESAERSQDESTPPTPEEEEEALINEGIGLLGGTDGGEGGPEPTRTPSYSYGGDGSSDGEGEQAWRPDADGEITTPTSEDGLAVEASGASSLNEPDGPATEEAATGGEGRGAVTTPDAPTIASLNDDKIWNPFTAGAGMGGVNDASATEESVAGTARDRYRTADEWIDSARQASPEGRVQTTEEGRSGGRSAVAYEAAYTEYASLAEAAVRAEALPPGRRALIQRYFEAIRPDEEEPSP
jgi:hypothetical protein